MTTHFSFRHIAIFGTALGLTALSCLAADTTWTGEFGGWTDPLNWSNGVPNNGGTTYNAFIGAASGEFPDVVLESGVVVDNLQLGRGSRTTLEVQGGSLTVLGETTFGTGTSHVQMLVYASNTASATADLGAMPAYSGGVLQKLGFQMIGRNGFTSRVQWEGAALQSIASGTGIFLIGDASIRNSLDDSDALAGLNANAGSLNRNDGELNIGGNFSNTGSLAARGYQSDGAVSIAGTLAENAGGTFSAGSLEVDSMAGHSAVLRWQGAEINAIASGATIIVRGANSSIRNSLNDANALAGLAANNGTLRLIDQSLSPAGNFSNAGRLFLGAGGGNTTFSIAGSLAQNAGGSLTAGLLSVFAAPGMTCILEWDGAQITTIAADAGVSLVGANAFLRNRSNTADALAGLQQNDGTLDVGGRVLAITGNFTNAGQLGVEDGGEFQLSAGRHFQNNGNLGVGGQVTTSAGGNLVFGEDSSLSIAMFGRFEGEEDEEPELGFGSLVVGGTFFLAGTFELAFNYDPSLISPSQTFTLLTASSVVGSFENITSGDRLEIADGEYSFLFTVDGTSVTLSDIQAVPEPSTVVLLAIVATGAWFIRRRALAGAIHRIGFKLVGQGRFGKSPLPFCLLVFCQ